MSCCTHLKRMLQSTPVLFSVPFQSAFPEYESPKIPCAFAVSTAGHGSRQYMPVFLFSVTLSWQIFWSLLDTTSLFCPGLVTSLFLWHASPLKQSVSTLLGMKCTGQLQLQLGLNGYGTFLLRMCWMDDHKRNNFLSVAGWYGSNFSSFFSIFLTHWKGLKKKFSQQLILSKFSSIKSKKNSIRYTDGKEAIWSKQFKFSVSFHREQSEFFFYSSLLIIQIALGICSWYLLATKWLTAYIWQLKFWYNTSNWMFGSHNMFSFSDLTTFISTKTSQVFSS